MDQWTRNLPYNPGSVQCGASTVLSRCYTMCAGYKYFSLQNGNTCFCGNSYGLPSSSYPKLSNASCGASCSRQSTAVQGSCCGGYWANAVYMTGIVLPYLVCAF